MTIRIDDEPITLADIVHSARFRVASVFYALCRWEEMGH